MRCCHSFKYNELYAVYAPIFKHLLSSLGGKKKQQLPGWMALLFSQEIFWQAPSSVHKLEILQIYVNQVSQKNKNCLVL